MQRDSARTMQSIMPSGASAPFTFTASMVMRWPTLRTSRSERPCKFFAAPSGAVKLRSAFMRRVICAAPFRTYRRIAFIRPRQFRYAPYLVLGVPTQPQILAVLDGRESEFEHEIGDPAGSSLADGVGSVDHDLDMQAVVDQGTDFGDARRQCIPRRRIYSSSRPSRRTSSRPGFPSSIA